MPHDFEPAGIFTFPLTADTAVDVEVVNEVPTLVISTAVAQCRFRPAVTTTITGADVDRAGELLAAVQLYVDLCHQHVAAKVVPRGGSGKDEPASPER
ncbi:MULTISPECIES: hypothetical protein [unclassified Crossiella]|uniref:hypothetical protein n=1 Tax=unclassified Crossiella TaxID=2620835 RepID=UPI002000326E|nr:MULTISPECIES: hypothetical protein [unclassified Crossiella]MCK2240958.1 hypothetical protein [Crossiella sp. S99.2]MCK2253898.1 hypothetical protein [Crossiella sp. S99.1]